MFKYRDPKTGMVLILNVAAQSDSEGELLEQVIHELGKLISAISQMTPTIRKVDYRVLLNELGSFSQARALNIVDVMRGNQAMLPAYALQTSAVESPTPDFDTGEWNNRFPEFKEEK